MKSHQLYHKDFDGQAFSPNGSQRYLHPGEGHIDFERFFAGLKGCKFNGYVSLEALVLNREGWADIEKLRRSLGFVRTLL